MSASNTADAPSAAETAPALRVLDGWWAADAYRAQYPDRAIETLGRFDEQGGSIEEEIIRSGAWDAACIDTDAFTLAELDALGLTLDLAAAPATAALAEGLYPSIRRGCSAGDKLVALPAGYIGTRQLSYRLPFVDVYGREDAEGAEMLTALGFTAADQPKTFAEVCALGLRYMALSRETRRGTCFLFSDTAPQGFALLYGMIQSYAAEATDAQGRLAFDTPDFRAALAAADPLLQAFAADPKRTTGRHGELALVLCEDVGVSQSYGAFPRVTAGDEIPAIMTVVVVNPNSPRLSEAIDYAALAAANGGDQLLLYQNADYDALLWQSYEDDVAAQIEQGEDASVIEELRACQARGDDKYFVPRDVIERYAAEIAPRLVFRRWSSFPIDASIQRYLSGELDADGFIAALNASANE